MVIIKKKKSSSKPSPDPILRCVAQQCLQLDRILVSNFANGISIHTYTPLRPTRLLLLLYCIMIGEENICVYLRRKKR